MSGLIWRTERQPTSVQDGSVVNNQLSVGFELLEGFVLSLRQVLEREEERSRGGEDSAGPNRTCCRMTLGNLSTQSPNGHLSTQKCDKDASLPQRGNRNPFSRHVFLVDLTGRTSWMLVTSSAVWIRRLYIGCLVSLPFLFRSTACRIRDSGRKENQ